MKRKRDRTQPVNWSAPEDRLASLQDENWQLKQALGYPIPADKETPQNPFKCGTCDARQQRVQELERERDGNTAWRYRWKLQQRAEAAEAREKVLHDALMAERERCAKIAESVVVGKPVHLRDEHRKPKSPSLTRQAIAAAIRGGQPSDRPNAG